jgi:hypothetical protein
MIRGNAWPPGRTARIGTWSRPGRPRANRAGSGGAAALNVCVLPHGEPLGAESTGRVPVGSRRLHDCVGAAGRRPGPRWAARDPGRCHGRRGHTGPCRPRQRPRRRREVARAQKTRPHRWRWNARERATGQGRAWAGGRREQAPRQRRVARLAPWAGTFEGTEPWQVSASVCVPEPLVRRHAQTAGVSATLVSHARGSGAARDAPAWSPSRQRGWTAPGRSWPVSGSRGTWLSCSHSV